MIAIDPGNTREAQTIFGTLSVPESHVLQFESGILGFPSCHEWVFVAAERPHTAWLQSLDEPALALLLIDPFVAFDGFWINLPPEIERRLDIHNDDAVAVYAPVTLNGTAAASTANLKGVIVLNWRTRSGVQCVLDSGAWSVQEPIPAAFWG